MAKKIVQITNYYWPHGGGVETHLAFVAQELKKRGYEQTIITQQYTSSLPVVETHQEIPIIRLPIRSVPTRNFFKKLRYKFAIWQAIWSRRQELVSADSIQIHDVFWWILPLLPIVFRKNIFMTFHGYEGTTPGLRQQFWHQLAAWCVKGSLAVGDFHQKWYGVRPTQVTYGGLTLPLSKIKFLPKSSLKTKAKKNKKIMFLGRLDADTGIMECLSALEIVLNRESSAGGEIQCDIYGDGLLATEIKRLVETKTLPVDCLGWQTKAVNHISEYDLIVTSGYLSILAALSYGKPVLAIAHELIKYDYLTMTPFADWITVLDLPNLIADFLMQDTYQRPPAEAAHWAQEQTWSRVADQYETLWHFGQKK